MQIFFKKNYYLSDVFMWSLKLGEISSLDGWIFTEELSIVWNWPPRSTRDSAELPE